MILQVGTKKLIAALILSLFASSFAEESSIFALSADQNSQAKSAITLALQTNYASSYKEIKKLESKNAGVACVIRNIVRLSEYDDTGDTTALAKAADELANCSADSAWDVLREFELGYAKTALGSSIKGALKTRSAAKKFEDSKDKDAQAIYSIYAYYVDEGLSFLPFVSDDRDAYLKILNERSANSELFWALFATPLAWMYYDKEDYAKALNVVERSLKKAPKNPVFIQMKADMLYKQKQYSEAAAIYEKSAADYLARTGKSVRYYCAIGNLARIYLDAGDSEKSKKNAEILREGDYKKIEKWMPESLVKDLKKKKLYP